MRLTFWARLLQAQGLLKKSEGCSPPANSNTAWQQLKPAQCPGSISSETPQAFGMRISHFSVLHIALPGRVLLQFCSDSANTYHHPEQNKWCKKVIAQGRSWSNRLPVLTGHETHN